MLDLGEQRCGQAELFLGLRDQALDTARKARKIDDRSRLERLLLGRRVAHAGVAAVVFCPVERRIGAPEQFGDAHPGAQLRHAGRDRQWADLRKGRLSDGTARALTGKPCRPPVGLGHEPREFLAAHARKDIFGTDERCQARGELGEDLIPSKMAMRIVDLLEVIEIEDHQAERVPVSTRPANLGVEPVKKSAVVGEASEWIGRCLGEKARVCVGVGDRQRNKLGKAFKPRLGLRGDRRAPGRRCKQRPPQLPANAHRYCDTAAVSA